VELYLHSHSTPSWLGAKFKKKAQEHLNLLPFTFGSKKDEVTEKFEIFLDFYR